MQQATQKGRQQDEQADGKADAQDDSQSNHDFGHSLAAQLVLQPGLKLRRLHFLLVLRVELGGVHQCLHALDHRVQKIHRAPDERHAQDGMPFLDEMQLLNFRLQLPVRFPDDDGLFLRAAH